MTSGVQQIRLDQPFSDQKPGTSGLGNEDLGAYRWGGPL
jgi:hypothetical protein